ncbi:MAG: PAC2 family protein [Dehalococcoidia bacterium]
MASEMNVENLPDLHNAVAVVAFSGWNDAASAATDAARFLIRRTGARRFASLDPESFYDFAEARPSVSIGRGGVRDVNWAKNEFFYARNPSGAHDLVIGVGVEPQLAWRKYTSSIQGLFAAVHVGLVVSLGALLADVPHTRPVRVTGTAADPAVAGRLDLTTSKYEGPTGIVGVLHDTFRRANLPAASLWANVPHYISTNSNPIATSALLTRLQTLVDMKFDMRELESAGERFVKEVDGALQGNSDVRDYVRRLESAADEASDQDPEDSELPEPEEIIGDIEAWLRGDSGKP